MVMAREGSLHSELDLSSIIASQFLFFYLFILLAFWRFTLRTCEQDKKV
jgi:hypothetical protein